MVGGSRHLLQPMLQFVAFRFMRLFRAAAPRKPKIRKVQNKNRHNLWLTAHGFHFEAGDRWLCYRKPPVAVWLISGNFTWEPSVPHGVHNKVMIEIKCVCVWTGFPLKSCALTDPEIWDRSYLTRWQVLYLWVALLLIRSKLRLIAKKPLWELSS